MHRRVRTASDALSEVAKVITGRVTYGEHPAHRFNALNVPVPDISSEVDYILKHERHWTDIEIRRVENDRKRRTGGKAVLLTHARQMLLTVLHLADVPGADIQVKCRQV